jgi:sortase (surface protein transpeptidase)
MKIVLATRPEFLLKNFYYLRKFLQGQDLSYSSALESAFLGRYQLIADQDLVDLVQNKQNFNQIKKLPSLKTAANWALNVIALIGLIVALVVFAPDLYYRVVPVESIKQVASSFGTPLGGDFQQGVKTGQGVKTSQGVKNSQAEPTSQSQNQEQASPTPKPKYIPPKDGSLPKGNWVIIPRIGVRSQLQKTAEPNEALETGIWWAPNFGEPGDTDRPMIVAGHRYGWKWWWRDEYWRYHSFNKLPELEPGDIVEIISDQRKWIYEIYAGEQGAEITDYEAHLILYTCKFLNSPVRYIRYARLVSFDNVSQF